eukprot:SAG31_NODE_887_length_11220_cov_9.210233_3_plen_75_part_00
MDSIKNNRVLDLTPWCMDSINISLFLDLTPVKTSDLTDSLARMVYHKLSQGKKRCYPILLLVETQETNRFYLIL